MASEKIVLLLTLSVIIGLANCQTLALLENFRAQIRACEKKHICSISVTTAVTSVTCTDPANLCNGVNDCPDMSDEMDCARCGNNEVLCRDTHTCAKVCDGIKQCTTGEDESGCAPRCPHGQMQCNGLDGNPTCAKVCDRLNECAGNVDETACPIKCPEGEILCRNKLTCAKLCDTTNECTANANEDETNCPPQCSCTKGQYICSSLTKCLPRADVCEGNGAADMNSCVVAANGMGEDETANTAFGYTCTA